MAKQPHLAIYNDTQRIWSAACGSQHLILHPAPRLQQAAQQLLQLRRPQPEKAAALM